MNDDFEAVSLPLPDPLQDQMKETPQNPRYHAEGSVYNHTCLVLSQFEQHHEQFVLSESRKNILKWACIVHDLGKPVVTRWVGKWSARGHEAAGVPIARNLLVHQSLLSPEEREEVLSLVRYHSAPLQLGLRGASIEQYKLLATRVDLRLLGQFAWFDLHGRICVDPHIIYDIIDRFLQVIVPRVEYEMGSFGQIREAFSTAGVQKKNALWYAYRQRNLPLIKKLLSRDGFPEQSQAAFQAVIPLIRGRHRADVTVRDQFPAFRHASFELPTLPAESQHIRSNHLRSARHFVSVFGKEGLPLLIEGPWYEQAYRDELLEFIRQQGGWVTLLEIDAMHPDEWQDHTQADQYPEAWIERQPHLIHPWEFHHREVKEWS